MEPRNLLKKLENINPWTIILGFFLLYTIFVLRLPNYLWIDEPIYYTQALRLKELNFHAFENTQPFGFPAFLALLGTENITLLRIANVVVFCIALFFIFKLMEKLISKSAGIISILLAGFSKLSVRYSISLFTEPLFILAMFASLYYFVSLFEQKSNKNYVLFTIFAAIAMQTRITGIFLFFALFSYLLFFERKHLTKKFLISFVVSGLIFLPYLILTDAKFLFEKSAVNYEFYHSFFLFLTNLAEDLSVSFVVLLCAALIFYHLDKRTRLIFYVAALYFIALMPTVLLNVRHVYPVFILLCTLIGGSFATDKKKRQFLIMSLLIFAFIAHNVYSYQQILGKVYQEYFVDVPEDCLELRNMKINGNPYNLPRFDQPASTEEYSTDFYLQKPSHYLIFEYDDDLIANIRLDNETLLEKYENSGLWSGFERGVVFMNISKGSHKLKFWIQNGKNVGGVAQVLVCKEFPNKNVEPKLFQLP